MKKKKQISFILILNLTIASIIFLGKCERSSRPSDYKRPGYNIILISLDTLRADRLGIYGYAKNTSPAIDDFAKKSILFENAFSNSNWTLPSHMSIMTSLYPSEHSVLTENQKLPSKKITLAEILKANGYSTAAFTGGYLVSKIFGFDRGFDVYKEEYKSRIENNGQGWRLKHIAKDIFFWLNKHDKDKFFLFIHCYDTHEPFIAHSHLTEFDQDYDGKLKALDSHENFISSDIYQKFRPLITGPLNINIFYMDIINEDKIQLEKPDLDYIRSLYDNEVRFVDHYFPKLIDKLQTLSLLEKTIIIITSDHGEELLERGKIQHGKTYYDELIRVPLIIYIPDKKGPINNQKLAQGIDIAPTILDILNLPPEPSFQGISLFPIGAKGSSFIIGQSKFLSTIRTEQKKLIYSKGHMELYDLGKDPEESQNIIRSDPNTAEELRKKLFDTLNLIDLDEKMKEKLKSLGYIR